MLPQYDVAVHLLPNKTPYRTKPIQLAEMGKDSLTILLVSSHFQT